MKPLGVKVRELGFDGWVKGFYDGESGSFVVVNGEVNSLLLDRSASVHEGFDF